MMTTTDNLVRRTGREKRTLIQGAVEVPEIRKMQEIVTMLANLLDAAHRLPEGTERQNALREIRG